MTVYWSDAALFRSRLTRDEADAMLSLAHELYDEDGGKELVRQEWESSVDDPIIRLKPSPVVFTENEITRLSALAREMGY